MGGPSARVRQQGVVYTPPELAELLVQEALQGARSGWVLDPACGLNSEHSVKRLQQWMREAVEE